MTNFEAIVKNHPQLVKEVLALNINKTSLMAIVEGNHNKHYGFYSAEADSRGEMDFLNKEYVASVLDDVEKRYLTNIIAPFKNKVKNIRKARWNGQYFIQINLVKSEHIDLPYFNTNSDMYKGMKVDERYTLKELGL